MMKLSDARLYYCMTMDWVHYHILHDQYKLAKSAYHAIRAFSLICREIIGAFHHIRTHLTQTSVPASKPPMYVGGIVILKTRL